MSIAVVLTPDKSRLRALLDHFAIIDDPREPWRVAHPLPEVLLLVVCGTIADCDDYEGIAEWGEAHLAFLRRFLQHVLPRGFHKVRYFGLWHPAQRDNAARVRQMLQLRAPPKLDPPQDPVEPRVQRSP